MVICTVQLSDGKYKCTLKNRLLTKCMCCVNIREFLIKSDTLLQTCMCG